MSRIRSVHPGLFTDPEFVMLSDAAQVFFIGLWTVADDNGAFAWAPMSLKMKLRPMSPYSVEPLLEELVSLGRIRRYEHEGQIFGVIRNFGRYQHPKFPRAIHFIPQALHRFVALATKDGQTTKDSENYGTPSGDLPHKNGNSYPNPSRAYAGLSSGEEERIPLQGQRPSLRSGLPTSPLRSEVGVSARERAEPPQGENQNLIEKGSNLLGYRKRALIAKMIANHGYNAVNNALDDIVTKAPANPAAFFITACRSPTTLAQPPPRYGPITTLWEGGARAAQAYIARHSLNDLNDGDETPQSLLDK